jgi:cyanophycinase
MARFLALVGGNEFRDDCVPMDRALLEVLGQEARVAILPTAAANENPGRAARNGVRYFSELGARAEAVMIVDGRTANDPALAGPLGDFNLIYLTGGSPVHLLESLRGSATLVAIRDVVARGGMLVGSSAGAMAMGARCWGFGDGWLEGWGLVPGVAVIPHHASLAGRWGVEEMQRRLAGEVALLGIDEATAAYGDGEGTWRVVGPGQVTVYAASAVRPYSSGETFGTSG